jgi:hypothetical protein
MVVGAEEGDIRAAAARTIADPIDNHSGMGIGNIRSQALEGAAQVAHISVVVGAGVRQIRAAIGQDLSDRLFGLEGDWAGICQRSRDPIPHGLSVPQIPTDQTCGRRESLRICGGN